MIHFPLTSQISEDEPSKYSLQPVCPSTTLPHAILVTLVHQILGSRNTISYSEVSRASLTIPHIVTVDFVKAGLRFVNQARAKACCSNKLVSILQSISDHFCFGFASKSLMRKLSNVLLRGLHNLEKDNPKDALIQTSVKKGRMADQTFFYIFSLVCEVSVALQFGRSLICLINYCMVCINY